jgi:diguanylate cyclase (GGDEF)-like protein
VFQKKSAAAALLVTADAMLFLDLQVMLQGFAVSLTPINSVREVAVMIRAIGDVDYLLLDVRMPAVEDGSLLAALGEWNMYRRGAVALIAARPGDVWIERLRKGEIDDIVPLTGDTETWRARLSAMQRNRNMQVELEELRMAAHAEMERDPVTGAFSREMVLKLLFRETDRVQRLRGELSLMLFSLEGFELCEEELGRQVCDGLLREVAARTGRALRSYDLLGRMGQHEFLAALPGCAPANARALAERLRVEVFGELFLVRNERGDFAGVELMAGFAVAQSMGRSPLVVLREAEEMLDEARRSRDGGLHPQSVGDGDGRSAGIGKGRTGLYLLPAEHDAERDGFHWLG